jgi:hypothetical protein
VGGAPPDDIARIHAVRAMLDAKVRYALVELCVVFPLIFQ